jgi:hypothetical protein
MNDLDLALGDDLAATVPVADGIARGVCRYLRDLGYAPLTEFNLGNKRRVDVIGLNKKGHFVVVEVKSSVADFRADAKWPDYLPHADAFYFAVDRDFPADILPADWGVLIADAYGAAVLRAAPETPVNAARRRAQTVRFAKTAAARLHRVTDPTAFERIYP